MNKLVRIYEGKAKMVFSADDPDLYIVFYKDDATAFYGKKKGTISGKGIVNNRVTNYLMKLLESRGISTNFVEELSEREVLVKKAEIIPIEVVVRNVAAGSLAKRFGLEEGSKLNRTVLEFVYKNDKLGDPMVNGYHIAAMGWATKEEADQIATLSLKINDVLTERFKEANIDLVDFRVEFGRLPDGSIILVDEVSPDTCRLWDSKTKERLDNDRFRLDMDGAEAAYQEILKRLLG